jgi:nitrate/nitrite transporter NarK
VVGIGGFIAGVGGFLSIRLAGRILDANHGDYAPIFLVCGVIYLAALGLFQLLVPRIGEPEGAPGLSPDVSGPPRRSPPPAWSGERPGGPAPPP